MLKTTSVTTRVPFLCFPRVDTTWTTFSKRFVTYLVERKLPRDLLILLWSPSGQQHVRLESPASSWHWGAWRPQSCKRAILTPADDILPSSHPLQMTSCPSHTLCRWHLALIKPPADDKEVASFKPLADSLLQKTFPAEDSRVPCRGRL